MVVALSRRFSGWRDVLGLILITYCAIFWALPVFVVFIFGELPYLEPYPLANRLVASAAVSFLLVTAYGAFYRGRAQMSGATRWQTVRNWTWASLGLVMFTVFAAVLSGNVFGALVKLAPGTPYSDRFVVLDVTSRGVRYKSAHLSLQAIGLNRDVSLTLSKRLFDYPSFQVRDELVLRGKQNIFGVYIESFEVLR